jgi:hypothetical protein
VAAFKDGEGGVSESGRQRHRPTGKWTRDINSNEL